MTVRTDRTRIEADPALPVIRIVREFDAPPARVFRPTPTRSCSCGGSPRRAPRCDWTPGTPAAGAATGTRCGGDAELATFWGSFHEVRSPDRIVRTQSLDGTGDGAILNTLTFEDLGDGRTRLTDHTLADTIEARDAILASGMESGVVAGHRQLDELLAELAD